MGFFSGIRRRVKKLIPKEIRPALPFIMAAAPIPGLGSLASRGLADQFLKAALTKAATDDEAGIKDILRTGAIAAAPQAVGKGLGSLASRFAPKGTDTEMFKMLTDAEKALSPGGGLKQSAKIVGGQAATDFGIKQAELNEKAIEEYERDLLQKGIRDKAARRTAIFDIFVGAGYDADETNAMLDKYGYADGGKVAKASMQGFGEKYLERLKKLKKRKEKKADGGRVGLKKGGDPRNAVLVASLLDKGYDLEEALKLVEEEFPEEFDAGEFSSNLQSGVSGLEAAFGQPLGGRRPEPMRIVPGFAMGGDVDEEVMETEEEIITPDYLMKEEGVEIGPMVSGPDMTDSLNELSLELFGRPIFELTPEEFDMLRDEAERLRGKFALKPGLIDEYRNYKYQMEEQGITPMSPRDYFRNEFGAARLGVAKGGPIKTQKPDMEKDTKGKMAAPDYYIKRMEDLMDLGYDYDTAGRIAMDYDEYRSAMDKGPIDDYKKGGKVIKIMPQGVLFKGKAKDYPGIKQLIKEVQDLKKLKVV